MDFSLPQDIAALVASVERFARTEILPAMGAFEEAATFPHPLIAKMGDAGFFGAAFPESLGGSDAGFLAVSAISETMISGAGEGRISLNSASTDSMAARA